MQPPLELHEVVTLYVWFIFLVLFGAGVYDSCHSAIDRLSPYATLARAPALPLQVWLPLVLALVRLHASRRAMRHNLAMGHLLPLDDYSGVHRVVAWIGFVLFSIHTLGHVLNLAYWSEGATARPELYAELQDRFAAFFDRAAGVTVWFLIGNNISVLSGIVMLVAFVWMLALSEERLTQ